MKLLTKTAAIATTVIVMSGCATGMQPVSGGLFSDVKGPLAVTSTNVGHSKTGSAKATSILGLIATGDASIAAAMEQGGITKVHHVDYHTSSILRVFAETTVTVYGE